MEIQLIRHATILLTIKGFRILVDPMLSEAGTMAAIPEVINTSNNPLVDLVVDPSDLTNADAILVTHVHRDHFDDAAIGLLPPKTLVFCQPMDKGKIIEAGFTDVQAVELSSEWNGITVSRTGGQHGTGEMGQNMGPVSGYVIKADDEPVVYIAGDTIWCSEVQGAIEESRPEVIVCNAGAAAFKIGGPITMTKEDVYAVCQEAPQAKVVVVHMEAWNHCSLTRQELAEYLKGQKVLAQVLIPNDGECIRF